MLRLIDCGLETSLKIAEAVFRDALSVIHAALVDRYQLSEREARGAEEDLLVWFRRLARRPGIGDTPVRVLRASLLSAACQYGSIIPAVEARRRRFRRWQPFEASLIESRSSGHRPRGNARREEAVRGRVLRFPSLDPAPALGRAAAQLALEAVQRNPRDSAAKQKLEHPESLLAICEIVERKARVDAGSHRGRTLRFCTDSSRNPNGRSASSTSVSTSWGNLRFWPARRAGTSPRREEAHLWFDRAEAGFRHTVNAEPRTSLVWATSVSRSGSRNGNSMSSWSWRRLSWRASASSGCPTKRSSARFLEAIALMEIRRGPEIDRVLRVHTASPREDPQNDRLLASAYANLTHVYGMVG